jgi:ribosome-associated heat shock protein Hsp15
MFYTNARSPVKTDQRRRTCPARGESSATIEGVERVRVDKWLWAARFAKTRSAATELVLAGHVKVGGERVKPAREVAAGDRIELRLGAVRRVVVVTGIADRRGPAKAAALLYEETPESREERERLALERRLAGPLGADLGARPTKQERRRLDALRRRQRRR